jgi:hypothetical protein
MKFKDFEFPSNPNTIEITSNRNVNINCVYGEKSVTENVSCNPTVISGSGSFFGDNADEYCTRLSRLLKIESSGWLYCPNAYPIKAFFSEFTYKVDSEKGCVQYNFTFIEDCSSKQEEKKFCYTISQKDENAFDIANREGVSVDDVMTLNDFKSPFDIKEGTTVKIR